MSTELVLVFLTLLLLMLLLFYIVYTDSYIINDNLDNYMIKETKENSLLITFDEMINYKYIPDYIKNELKGYQAFKKIGVEFTNIHNNRQDCSAARSTMFTSEINHGISDDIQEDYQYESFPCISEKLDTIGKIYKQNNYDLTAFYGKNYMDANLTKDYRFLPKFSLNTRGAMKAYGFDIFNTFGDTSLSLGVFGDNREFQSTVPPTYLEFDYIENDMKLVGIIPFLKARVKDKKSFHAQYHMVNPHDTMQLYQNTSQKPAVSMGQFLYPFLEEQSNENYYTNPFIFNDKFKDAWIKDKNLIQNFFENNYQEYSNNVNSLPFKEEYLRDYVSEPESKVIVPFFAGSSFLLENEFSIANSSKDIKSWKNLINNYYGLIKGVDDYLYRIYSFLVKNDMLKNTSVIITADHGDQVSSHGLKQKGFPFKESENIPFIIYSPNLDKNFIGKTIDTLGSHLDLNPTLEVISKLEEKSKLFKGRSLVRWYNNKLFPVYEDEDTIQICNSTMHFEGGYSGYLEWKVKNRNKNYKILFDPNNIFEFQYSFIMLNTRINGEQYKFCKFFNYKQLMEYNLEGVFINKDILSEISNDYYNIKNYKFLSDVLKVLPDNFLFTDGLNIITNNFGKEDSHYLCGYYMLLNSFLIRLNGNIVKLPCIDRDYKTLKYTNTF